MEKSVRVLPIIHGRRIKLFTFKKAQINETLKELESSARRTHASTSFQEASILSQMLCPSGLEKSSEEDGIWLKP